MTIRQQSAALGADPGQVCRWRKSGMSPDDLEAAREWISRNVRRRAPRGKKIASLPQPPVVVAGDPADLAAAKTLASKCYNIAAACAGAAELSAAVSAYRQACVAVAALERALVARETDARTLVHIDEVRSVIAAETGKLRGLLENLPTAAAAQANPADPELAESALRDAVEQILATLSGVAASV